MRSNDEDAAVAGVAHVTWPRIYDLVTRPTDPASEPSQFVSSGAALRVWNERRFMSAVKLEFHGSSFLVASS